MNTCYLCGWTKLSLIQRNIQQCRRCHFVQVVPRLAHTAYTNLYKDDWEHFGPYLSQIPAHRLYFNIILDYVGRSVTLSGARILDVGCALGILLEEALKRKMKAEGVDISQAAVGYARKKKLAVTHNTCVSFQKRNQIRNTYDVITALEVVEHDEDPRAMLESAYSMLKKGGMLLITTPNFDTIFRKIMGKGWIGYRHREHLWFFTPKTMTKLLAETGFSPVTVRSDFRRSYSVSYMFRRIGEYIPVLAPVMRLCQKLNRRATVVLPCNPWGDMLVVAIK